MNDKELVAHQALQYVNENMIVGLGTGSTANYFIDALAKRNKEENLKIRAVSSSVVSMIKAKEAGLPIIAMEQIKEIDLYIDGADEIAPDLTLLKGRGYDLVREKLLARSAKKFIVIADESKLVKKIGDNFPIPSEVQPFAWELVKNILIKKGTGDIRINAAKDGYAITSCGNFVLDFNYPEKSTEELNALLSQTPGIVEHGIFYNIAHGALISSNGKVREIWKN
ncbi:RpiA Ribose 5-phosphate isomerase [Candidatus Methylopumilus universalis]